MIHQELMKLVLEVAPLAMVLRKVFASTITTEDGRIALLVMKPADGKEETQMVVVEYSKCPTITEWEVLVIHMVNPFTSAVINTENMKKVLNIESVRKDIKCLNDELKRVDRKLYVYVICDDPVIFMGSKANHLDLRQKHGVVVVNDRTDMNTFCTEIVPLTQSFQCILYDDALQTKLLICGTGMRKNELFSFVYNSVEIGSEDAEIINASSTRYI